MSFKEAMSSIANTVSVLAVRNTNERVHACTISSLVSLSVIEDDETVLFVLKKNSKTGALIKERGSFSINVLSGEQSSYASEYSSSRDEEFVSQAKWTPHNNEFVKLIDCKVFFACKIEKIVDEWSSDLYIARVMALELNNDGTCLVYKNRSFGVLELINERFKTLS